MWHPTEVARYLPFSNKLISVPFLLLNVQHKASLRVLSSELHSDFISVGNTRKHLVHPVKWLVLGR